MRVIAGTLRGRILMPPRDRTFRPTTDRVKEAIFNILSNRIAWPACRVLDLFAGTGSLGIEAASRGARNVTFVDNNPDSLRVLNANLEKLGLRSSTTVHFRKVEEYLAGTSDSFGLIIADPPYGDAAPERFLASIATRALLEPEGIVLLEHAGSTSVPAAPPWTCLDTRRYGTTGVTLFAMSQGRDERIPEAVRDTHSPSPIETLSGQTSP